MGGGVRLRYFDTFGFVGLRSVGELLVHTNFEFGGSSVGGYRVWGEGIWRVFRCDKFVVFM